MHFSDSRYFLYTSFEIATASHVCANNFLSHVGSTEDNES